KKTEISNEEMDNELKKLANSRVKLVTVNREAKKGDSAEIDFQVSRNNVPIENGSSKNHPLVLGSNAFIPGFEENIIGMKEKEEKEFEIQFPDKYHDKNLAGKPAEFKVKVNLVQERQTPEINDDFAKSLGKFKDLEELKDSVKDGLLKGKEEKQKEQKRTEFIEKLIEAMKVDVPEVLIHSELHKMVEEFGMQLQGMGMDIDGYLEKMKKTREDLEKEWIPQAEKRIKSSMALEKIAKELDIKASSDKIEEEMNKTLQQYKNVKDLEKNVDTARLYNYVKGILTNEEVFRYLERL
ncbi:MAG TPA: trigger factor, partial [Candidatus Moranbacteria bacterium]|nr:trigger factor [Candidatus Moranbacteria bacterium]